MNKRNAVPILVFAGFMQLCFCSVPFQSAVLKALDKSDLKAAVAAAKNDSRTAKFLAQEIIIRSASDKSTKSTLDLVIRGGGKEILPVLNSLKNHECKRIRAVSLMKLHKFGKRGALEDLEPFLDSDKGLVRVAAVEAFLMEDQKKGFYENYILDPEVNVRLKVVQHLATLKSNWALELLYDVARNDPEPAVREVAIKSLDPENEKHLELLKNITVGEDPSLTLAALQAIVKSPETATLPWMEKFLTTPVTAEGIYYAASLLKHEKSSAAVIDYLKTALFSSSPTIRQKLVGALGMYKVSLDEIEKLADDKNSEVQLAWSIYARKMGKFSGKRKKVLRALAKRKDDVALRAIIALSEEKDVSYDSIRNLVWHSFKKGQMSDKKYLLNFMGLSIIDPPLPLEAMADDDPVIRLYGAAAYLKH